MNSFFMMMDIRENIGEAFSTSGGYADHWTDRGILRKMNAAQKKVASLMMQSPGDWFLTSTTLTPSSSIITLPADCVKPVYLEETTSGIEIPLKSTTVRERRLTRLPQTALDGGALEAYFEDLYLVVNKTSYTEGVTLWYYKRVPDLAFGTIATGAASSLTMESAMSPSYMDDYYNNVTVETMGTTNLEIKLRSTVSDYAASTRIMTVTGTPTSDDYYGTISILPRQADYLITLEATLALLARPSSALDPKYYEYFVNERREERKVFDQFLSNRAGTTTKVRTTGDDL